LRFLQGAGAGSARAVVSPPARCTRIFRRCPRLFFHVPADQRGAVLDEFLLHFIEGLGKVALDTQLGHYAILHHALLHKDGHYNIGFHQIRPQVARIGRNIIDHHGFPGSGRRSAQSFVERNTQRWRKAADVRSQHQSIETGGFH